MDFRDILVIKLVPLAVNHILTVSYVVSTCRSRKYKKKRGLRKVCFGLFPKMERKKKRERETRLSHTSCGAVVANDRQQIISGDLGWTLFSQERLHVKALQWEGYMAANLE